MSTLNTKAKIRAHSRPFVVLNAGGRDPDQDFPDFAGEPNPEIHAPVNYHGFAACAGGAFVRSIEAVRGRNGKNVLLLLRSDPGQSLKVLNHLKAVGCKVWIAFKESGLHQISTVLTKKSNAADFRALCLDADGALASTEDAGLFYRAAGCEKVLFLPTPYPVDDPRWDFSRPIEERLGIFVGTREFDVPSRNHLTAVLAAFQLGVELGEPVSVVNVDGNSGRQHIAALQEIVPDVRVDVIDGRRSYPDYLHLISGHRIVFQLDASAVPGQVAGDALLCRVPCVGGNGTTERLAFPHLNGHGRDIEEVLALARRLLTEPTFYRSAIGESQRRANEKLSFAVIRDKLDAEFL
ncbi:MAG TPA: hypothetical protein VIT21_00430 [Chthoniobacterales bacterium]